VISGPDGILLKPAVKEQKITSLTESLFGIFNKYTLKKHSIKKTIKPFKLRKMA